MRVRAFGDEMMRVGLVTLGCDKNTVDNEYLAGMLEDAGCEVCFEPDPDAGAVPDVVVVTTCGFIGDAKEQSVAALVAWADRKRDSGAPQRVFVTGCLAQRYATDLLAEIPELDGVVGVGQFADLVKMILRDSADASPRNAARRTPSVDIRAYMRRRRADDAPHSFLKISDGCDYACAFCAIPGMKGRMRSVPRAILLEEAEALVRAGVRELNLVAQDISTYGRDRKDERGLPCLLRELCAIPGDFWVRCLYCYPGGITPELVETLAGEPKIVPYLDIPLQHLDPEILRRMRRPHHRLDVFRLVERLRAAIPGVVLRTTMLVGFPGETPGAHRRMLDGLRALAFDWVGAFAYSKEEGTPAAVMPRQVGAAVRERRRLAVLEQQAEITAERLQTRVGSQTRVLIEDVEPGGTRWLGRSPGEAPETDGLVYVESDRPLTRGEFVMVEITGSDVYDLVGRVV